MSNFAAFSDTFPSPLEETYSKYGAGGQLEDYWCSSGEKVVIPSAFKLAASTYKLECSPTFLYFNFVYPGTPSTEVSCYKIDYQKLSTTFVFFCDV
jgi:hypothetical protein